MPTSLSYIEVRPPFRRRCHCLQGLFDYARLQTGRWWSSRAVRESSGVRRSAASSSLSTFGNHGEREGHPICATVSRRQDGRPPSPSIRDELRDADAVLDLLGGDTETLWLQTLGGRLISTVSKRDQDQAKQHTLAPPSSS